MYINLFKMVIYHNKKYKKYNKQNVMLFKIKINKN